MRSRSLLHSEWTEHGEPFEQAFLDNKHELTMIGSPNASQTSYREIFRLGSATPPLGPLRVTTMPDKANCFTIFDKKDEGTPENFARSKTGTNSPRSFSLMVISALSAYFTGIESILIHISICRFMTVAYTARPICPFTNTDKLLQYCNRYPRTYLIGTFDLHLARG